MSQTVDVVVIGLGPGGEDVAGRLAEAGLDGRGGRARAGRRRVPLLGLRAEQDDDPGGRPAGRGPAHPRHGRARPPSTPDWAPVATRIREEATDTWDDTVAVDRFVGKGGRFVRGAGPPHRARREVDGRRRGVHRPARHRASHRHRAVDPARRRAWPARRTGPTARPSRPRSRPRRCSCSAAAPSGPSWPRCSPASAAGSPSSRPPTACCPWRSRRPAPSLADVFEPRGHRRPHRG